MITYQIRRNPTRIFFFLLSFIPLSFAPKKVGKQEMAFEKVPEKALEKSPYPILSNLL